MSEANFIEPEWDAPPGVRALSSLKFAGSFGREAPDNRQRLGGLAGLPSAPVWLQQVHGTQVVEVAGAAGGGADPVADAAVTRRTGVVCVVQTADCLPVLFAACDGSAIGAAHAGWRGLAAGVLEACVAALRQDSTPGVEILAWLGPAISAAHFEVGEEVRTAFLHTDPGAEVAFLANARGRWQCDLYALARRRLSSQHIHKVWGGQHCTYAETDRFWSHRRDTVAGHAGTGRMASLIWKAA